MFADCMNSQLFADLSAIVMGLPDEGCVPVICSVVFLPLNGQKPSIAILEEMNELMLQSNLYLFTLHFSWGI